MSRKSARQFINIRENTQNSTTALFVQNHTSPKHLLAQVETLFDRGELHPAKDLVECIIDNNNALVSSADLFVLHAKIFIELCGFNVDAQCAVQQALLLEPQNAEALKFEVLANIHEDFRDGLYEQGENSVREVLAADTDSTYGRFLLGYHMFWKNGSQTEAVELLEKCVQKRPSFLRAWLCLAMAYKKNQELAKAEKAFQECLAIDANPTNLDFYKNHLQSI